MVRGAAGKAKRKAADAAADENVGPQSLSTAADTSGAARSPLADRAHASPVLGMLHAAARCILGDPGVRTDDMEVEEPLVGGRILVGHDFGLPEEGSQAARLHARELVVEVAFGDDHFGVVAEIVEHTGYAHDGKLYFADFMKLMVKGAKQGQEHALFRMTGSLADLGSASLSESGK